MKLPKNVSINPELGFYYPVINMETNKVLLGRWIGTVEVVVDGYQDEDGWEYATYCFLAYQLISGRIIYVEGPIGDGIPHYVHSLKGTLYDIRWGHYPIDFPKEWQYCVAAPTEVRWISTFDPVETDELPF